MKTQIFLITIITLLFSTLSFAQPFDKALGARLGYGTTVSYKKFISEHSALEFYGGLYGYSGADLGIGGLYQYHKPIKEVENLSWYFGGGATARTWIYLNYSGGLWVGAQGCLGLDYKFDELPINISLDWLPTIWLVSPNWYSNYTGYNRFGNYGSGISIRYIFGE